MRPRQLHLRVLGEPGLSGPGGERVDLPLGKPFALLCFLALQDDPVTRDELTDLLWSGSPRDRARGSLRQALWLLRKSTTEELFDVDGERVAILGDALVVDLDDFRSRLAAGELEEALELWGDGPFAGFTVPDAPSWNYWADEVRTRLEEHFLGALHDQASATLQDGGGEEAVRWVEAALRVRPYSGGAHALRIEILLELRELERAEEALLEARGALEEAELERIDELEEKLRHLRRQRFRHGGPSLTTEFVGRSDAFARLSECWRNALAGRPRMVALLGPPGIGKTRLAEEFIDFALLEEARVVSARGVHAEERIEWGVVAEVARQLHRLPGAAGIGTASHGLLRALLPTLDGGLAPGEDRPTLQPAALADAMADLVSAVSHEQPLVLMVDDLHWVDPASRGLLSHLARALAGSRVLLLVTCRTRDGDPGVLHGLRLIEEGREATLVTLSPLAEGEIREMVGFLGDVRDHDEIRRLSERIHGLTGGNPLLVREMLQALRQQGLLERTEDGRWCFTDDLDRARLPLPDAVRDSLRSQVDGLGTDARNAARALARAGQPVFPEGLQRRSGLPPRRSRLVEEELLEKGLARVTPDGRIDVAHERIRDVLLALPDPDGGREARPERRTWIAASVIVLLALGATAAGLLRASGKAPPPFGGGLLLVGEPDGVVSYRPDADGGWLRGPSIPAPPGAVLADYGWNARGEALQAVGYTSRNVAAPYAIIVDEDGTPRPLLISSKDAGAVALSPSGLHTVLHLANPASDAYQVNAVRLDVATGDTTHLLAHPALSSGSPDWSPDGRYIAVPLNVAHDSVVVLRPDGRRVDAMTTPDRIVSRVGWCASSERLLVATLPAGGGPRIWTYELESRELRAVPTASPVTHPSAACSPDGSAFAYLGRVEGDARVLIQGWGGEILADFPTRGSIRGIEWLPDPPPLLPVRLHLANGPVSLGWGERRQLDARVTAQDDRALDSAGVEWISREPGIASVLPGGVLSGNGRGHTWIVAEVDGWIRDSLAVEVTGQPTASVLWADPLATLDRERWQVFGSPDPEVVSREGASVLWMTGDGVYSDGIFTRNAFRLPRGGTVRLAFRLPLTRTDRQAVSLCLSGLRPEEVAPGDQLLDHHRYVCFGYPAMQGVDHHRSEIGFSTHLQVTGPIRVPELLPTDGWTTAAIQLRADGQPSLYLDGRHVRTFDLSVENGPDTDWRVFIGGRSVDTELLVRDLVVWNEERYPDPGAPLAEDGSESEAAPLDGTNEADRSR